jgi:hypothetical protein
MSLIIIKAGHKTGHSGTPTFNAGALDLTVSKVVKQRRLVK